MIRIDLNKCIGCGLCAWDCFPAALSCTDGKAQLSAPENCIGCGHCIAICPKQAVEDPELPMDDIQPVHKDVAPQTLLDLMQSRRSCRHYTSEKVSDADIMRIIDAIRACPTAKNLQRTRYIVVRDSISELLDATLEALGRVGELQKETAADPSEIRRADNFIRWAKLRKEDKSFDPLFFHAPMLLMLVSDGDAARDASAGAAYGELMAASLGLGCLYSGYFTACCGASSEIQNMLGISPQEQVVRCLVLGHPDVKFRRTAPRRKGNIQYI